ncbi:SDR family NAD(P)-dependent oxidoreductase, partial [Amycolatopsis sp. NPDC059657]|uniref:SDR family NAD(P)-dependent oxidoreductase n=1 Tax=Amycolatopsis sp. NPDC059657 TaxID=3346899 RepID=UPI00366E5DF6
MVAPGEAGEISRSEGIAVVGLSCRLPDASSPAEFWRLLSRGRDAVGERPSSRRAEGAAAERAGYLDQVDRFDAEFFGISPKEASAMDPQQRLALELSWEALEEAGLPPATLSGTRTGVFVGTMWDDYAARLGDSAESLATRHSFAGLQRAGIANRISYFLGLTGPSMVVDSGQSSSLVAVHLACESLRRGESSLAVAAGVNLMLASHSLAVSDAFGALSPDARCFTFDARANGYVRGEGGGVVVLKRLDSALADGDQIHCVILGGAVNNDGAGDTYTAPSGPAQEQLLAAACRRAAVAPVDVTYVELHGTGTALGDRVEAAALGTVYGRERPASRPLRVGSAKTNVGHLEGAAGITGLLKVVLSLKNRALPPSLNFETPNPRIDFAGARLAVQQHLEDWRAGGRLIAGVSSFGLGGTNCHLIVGEAPKTTAEAEAEADEPATTALVLSARSDAALGEQAEQLRQLLEAPDGPALGDTALSLAVTRTHFRDRAVLLGSSREELLNACSAVARGEESAVVVRGSAREHGKTVFVFPGQGTQWTAMAAELLDSSPVFARSIEECGDALASHLDWSLGDVLRGAPGVPDPARDDVVQPVTFAVMVSLARLWAHHGVSPDAVIGHSQGEIAAAHIAGALSLEDAAAVVALRSKAIVELTAGSGGGMASVELAAEEVRTLLERWGGSLEIAASNSPLSTVVSGDRAALDELIAVLKGRNVRHRLIPVGYASHTSGMEPLRRRLLTDLSGIRTQNTEIACYSTLTGGRIAPEALTAAYWYRNLRYPVQFEQAVRAAAGDGHDVFIESSPHPVLTTAIRHTVPGVVAAGTLRRDHGGMRQFLTALGQAHVHGVHVDWAKTVPGARRVALPTYPFQRSLHWIDTAPVSPPVREPETRDLPESPAAGPVRSLTADPVRQAAAAVLGYARPDEIDITRTFRDLGFDSAATIEFSDRLSRLTGTSLPATLAFEHPTPEAVIDHLTAGAQPAESVVADRSDDPIAIVAMSGRWPGGTDSPDALWRLLLSGGDVIGPVPADRGWEQAGITGGFLHDAFEFDNDFFGVSPREAAAMDPQQRLLLESAWEAVERSGIAPMALRGTDTGVFLGVTAQDYGPRLHEAAKGYEGHALTGSFTSVASGRIAYVLGLEGPAITVDTACSSSLVALHLAAQALRHDECRLALAGGAAVMALPGMVTEFGHQNGLAADGRCKPFSAAADGTGWSEGVGMLLLERLSDARRNGHPVLAVIRGSAVNSDGASNGLSAPNGLAQQRVIRQALTNAHLTAGEIDAVEAHGTGTALGDPIEARALLATYGQDRRHPVLVGSVKSCLGHTQAAAGVTGVIATVLAMRHGLLPRTLHLDRPSPHVDWNAGAVELLAESREWPETDHPRRAGVSSFGISGTNAHVILEQVAAEQEPGRPEAHSGPLPWLLSAKSDAALRELSGRLAGHLGAHPDVRPDEVAAALAASRSAHGHRAVVIADDRTEAVAAFEALRTGDPSGNTMVGTADPSVAGPVFVFPGQGSQWAGMALALLDTDEAFAAALDACAQELEKHVPWRLHTVLRDPDPALLMRSDVVQPVMFAITVALARTWQQWGVQPAAIIGHSQGEIAAAHVAGALTLADAALIVTARSVLLTGLPAGTGMVSIRRPADELDLLDDIPGLTIAAVNGPSSTVVAGTDDELKRVLDACGRLDIDAARVPIEYASHSPHVRGVENAMLAALASVSPQDSEIPFYSTVTGGRLGTAELDGRYWYANLSEQVRFHQAVTALVEDGHRVFLEVSPQPVLAASIRETLGDRAGLATGTLRRNEGGRRELLRAAARLHVAGVGVDWTRALPPLSGHVELPTYPFQRTRFWLPGGNRAQAGPHPLIDTVTRVAGAATVVFAGRLSAQDHPWLSEHTVRGVRLLPVAVYVELLTYIADETGFDGLDELVLHAPLIVPEQGGLRLQVVVEGNDVSVYSQAEQPGVSQWVRHATASLATGMSTMESAADDDVLVEATLAPSLDPDQFRLHPSLLDAVLRAAVSLTETGGEPEHMPFSLSGIRLDAIGATVLHARLRMTGADSVSVVVTDPSGEPVISVDSLVVRPLPAELRPTPEHAAGECLYEQVLTELEAAPPAGATRMVRVLPDEMPLPEHRPGDLAVVTSWSADSPGPQALRSAVTRMLTLGQAWLTDREVPLVVATRGALAADADPSGTAVWGLVRSAQAEHPGRFVLVDLDPELTDEEAVAMLERHVATIAAQVAAGQAQLVLRAGRFHAPRLARSTPSENARASEWNPEGTVLITGGTGGLAGLLARHLVAERGVRHLVLASRSGPTAAGADELSAELTALGAQIRVVACDVADRGDLSAMLAGIDADHPLTAVVHTAAVLDDGVVEGLTPGRLDTVLAPKADGAWHLHELTRDLELAAFVLYSSLTATVESAGLGSYAAANGFLDGLAAHRCSQGLPATSLAWGPWSTGAGMTGALTDVDLRRFGRSGMVPLAAAEGLALFDAALDTGRPVVVAARLDSARWHEPEDAPQALRDLIRRPARRAAKVADRVDGGRTVRQFSQVLELVRTHAAAVLGYADAARIDADRPFRDMGFDSLTAVELRNRLTRATSLTLPATLTFNHPTARSLATFLVTEMSGVAQREDVRSAPAPAADEPLAIVGMACRFPGGVDSPEALWSLVEAGADVIGEFPTDRGWNLDGLFDADPDAVGKTYARAGGFLREAGLFDPSFFGISPREALVMDPQQRLLLETSWEALERAGIDPGSLRGQDVGVYFGLQAGHYGYGNEDAEGLATTGMAASVAAGRVSYVLGLEGPAVTVDTACSSSLSALHLAGQALRAGECSLALAGAVTVMATPDLLVEFARQRGLSPDGRCRAFADSADGTGFSEGVGVLVLERLSDARRNGHQVLAVVRGSAVNQDGASNGLTAPNGMAQERVIRRALANAGVTADEVDVVEAHGTGTRLGDPIEAQALLATYGQDRDRPL